jgi:glutamine amidotransferase-like uncharacterized protein
MSRRAFLQKAALAGGGVVAGACTGHDTTQAPAPAPPGARTALVYRGPATPPGCPEAVHALLRASRWGFDVRYVGPREAITLSADALRGAALYAQPGGGDLAEGYRELRAHGEQIRDYVAAGGRYAGFCLGGYLAGSSPGFGLLPGDSAQFIASANAGVDTEEDTVVPVLWRGRPRHLFFQDGPYFQLRPGAANVTVLATYANGEVAAMAVPFGSGRVAVVGPHPEATADWYAAYGLDNPDGIDPGPGHDLIDTLMAS